MSATDKVIKIELRDPRKLKPHPANESIYGEEDDDKLVESIQKHGLTDPPDILPDNTIVGGHRRVRASITAGLKYIPVKIRGDIDAKNESEVLTKLLNLNQYRDKSNVQKVAEYEQYLAAEKELAHVRKSTKEAAGRASDIAAKKAGLSPKTAAKAAKVSQKIREHEASGNFVAATALRNRLNESIEGAAREISYEAPRSKFDEAIAISKWDLDVAVPRLQEHAIMLENILGPANYQAARVQQLAKTLFVVQTNALRIAEHAKKREEQS